MVGISEQGHPVGFVARRGGVLTGLLPTLPSGGSVRVVGFYHRATD